MLRFRLGELGWRQLAGNSTFRGPLPRLCDFPAGAQPYHASAICQREKSKATKNFLLKRQNSERLSSEDEARNPYLKPALARTSKPRSDMPKWHRFVPETLPMDLDVDEAYVRTTREKRLKMFLGDPSVFNRCACFGIDRSQFELWSAKYVAAASADKIERLKPASLVPLLARDGMVAFDDFLVNQFFAFLAAEAPDVVANIKFLREITDFRYPHEWATGARRMQRRIIMHVGPTNSGKTYRALQRLQETKSGLYCSPLRLLAYEVFNRLTNAGIACSLLTGEDRRTPDFEQLGIEPAGYLVTGKAVAGMVSCTVEMAPNVPYDVAVIDEIQMISDRSRGWAWTNALLNLRANEIHLCGEPSAVPLIKRICASLDEEVEVNEYSRLGSLDVSPQSLGGKWSNIQKGDCVVAFSRKGIFETKDIIEKETKLRCAVIYGGLPPESRVEQARLFNDPDSGYDVLVASDAVGMGINLTINRVVFTALSKFDGESARPISVSQTRQIGGRAGRFNSGVDGGTVTTFDAKDIKHLGRAMNLQPHHLCAAGLKPSVYSIEVFSHQFPKVPFSQLWSMFRDVSSLSDSYFLSSFRDQEQIAMAIGHLNLSVRDMYEFIYAPINCKDDVVNHCLVVCAGAVARNVECKAADAIRLPKGAPKTRAQLLLWEQWHRAITLYLWLTFHFPDTFTQYDEALELKTQCEGMIQTGLMSGIVVALPTSAPATGNHATKHNIITDMSDIADIGLVDQKALPPVGHSDSQHLEQKTQTLDRLRRLLQST